MRVIKGILLVGVRAVPQLVSSHLRFPVLVVCLHEPGSKLLVSPLITHTLSCKEFRLQLTCFGVQVPQLEDTSWAHQTPSLLCSVVRVRLTQLISRIKYPDIVHLTSIEYGVYGDLLITYPKPYSIYFRGTISSQRFPKETQQLQNFLFESMRCDRS